MRNYSSLLAYLEMETKLDKLIEIKVIDGTRSSPCKILPVNIDGFICVRIYKSDGSFKGIINIKNIVYVGFVTEQKIENCKSYMWKHYEFWCEENMPKLTEEEKEKKRGRLSISIDKSGGLSNMGQVESW